MKTILLTGGLGYIGSNVVVSLCNQKYDTVILDNLSNSNLSVLKILKKITKKNIKFYNCDIRDRDSLANIFIENEIDGVMHFAGLKSVRESEEMPKMYHDINVNGTAILIEEMQKAKVKKLIFSSSATVYGNPKYIPIDEKHSLDPINEYGLTKLKVEKLLENKFKDDSEWSIFSFRYFNPIGAQESGLLGDKPRGIPNNIMPYINLVASKERVALNIYGNDYETKDGTGVRDYIHVLDIAEAHIAGFNYCMKHKGYFFCNLGTGIGVSVLQLIKIYEKKNNLVIPFEIKGRRKGDVAEIYADPTKALEILGWQSQRDIMKMCSDSWKSTKILL